MTAPLTRTVDQFSGAIVDTTFEAAVGFYNCRCGVEPFEFTEHATIEDYAALNRWVGHHNRCGTGAVEMADTLAAGLPVANAQLAEVARLREELDGKKTELDNVMYQFRHLGETTAGLTGLMNDYHTERDDAREDAEVARYQRDQMQDERDEALTRVQELEQEAAERDAAVDAEAEACEDDQC